LILLGALLGETKVAEDLTWMEARDAIPAGKATAIYAASIDDNGPNKRLARSESASAMQAAADRSRSVA